MVTRLREGAGNRAKLDLPTQKGPHTSKHKKGKGPCEREKQTAEIVKEWARICPSFLLKSHFLIKEEKN